MSNDERQSVPAKAGISFLTVAGSVLSAALWMCLIWAVYLKVPTYRRLFDDFGNYVGPQTMIVLDYAGFLLPIIGIAAGACLTANRSRRIWAFVLFWLPLRSITGLVIAVGPPFMKLLNNLD